MVKKLFLKYVVSKSYEEGGFLFYFVSKEDEWTSDRSKAHQFATRLEAKKFTETCDGPVNIETFEIRK